MERFLLGEKEYRFARNRFKAGSFLCNSFAQKEKAKTETMHMITKINNTITIMLTLITKKDIIRSKRRSENMYTEIVKIIEGGLQGDKEKVQNYANVLANNLEKEGEVSLSKKIRGIVENRRKGLTSLDSFATKPVDTESRMEIVQITTPQIKKENIKKIFI